MHSCTFHSEAGGQLVPDLLTVFYSTTAMPPHYSLQSSITAEATEVRLFMPDAVT